MTRGIIGLGGYNHDENLSAAALAPFFIERFGKDESDLVKTDAVRAVGKAGGAASVESSARPPRSRRTGTWSATRPPRR